jgi:hypothetical protein
MRPFESSAASNRGCASNTWRSNAVCEQQNRFNSSVVLIEDDGWSDRGASKSNQPDPRCGRPLQQPEHLTALQPQKLRRCRGRQPTLIQIPQHLEPRKLSIAHRPNRHPKRPPENPKPAKPEPNKLK